ncbi:MAG TPA: 50S ribosomal protein L10 [Tepidisphaeraceae bacterium]|nr:50S ribosomal protein L10 [Tepidisphaeraceae bacterium]
MSKPVKSLIEKEMSSRFKDVESVAVINPRGIDAIKNNQIRRRLRDKGVRMTVVKNSLVKRAASGTKLKGFDKLLEGPTALIYGKASISAIARLLLDEKKTDEKIELRGIFFDGEVYAGEEGVKKVSKFPTREEAVGLIVAVMLSPGRKLAGTLKSQAGKIGSLIKAIEEKAKEKESAAPAAPAAAEAPAT